MNPIKLGVLGTSHHFVMRIIKPLKNSKLIELYAISSRDKDKAREISLKYDIPKFYSSYQELLDDKSIEMVFIPLPNHMHLEWIKKAADAGKHIICEKPLSLNSLMVSEAIDYAVKKGVKMMEAFMYKFHPQWIHIRDLIKYRRIGNVHTIHTFFGFNNKNPEDIRNIKDFGGGALYDIGCYAVSSSRFALGKEPERLISFVKYDEKFATDILSSGIIDFGETQTLFTVSTQTYPFQKVEIFGSEGIINVELPFNPYDDINSRITVMTGNSPRTIEFSPIDQYQLEFDSFAEAVIENRKTPIPPNDALNNMKVIDALFRSAASGKWENII
jgi:predicted dehydrogenase